MIDQHDLKQIEQAVGPQYRRDTPFMARMRFHQSWYRARKLKVSCGFGPTAASARRYGNMLTISDGERGLNFLTPEIGAVARARIHEANGLAEAYRLQHNMLSSQPMCFNLFGPLRARPPLATRLLQAILPDEIAEVSDVQLEYAPAPRSRYLNDHTAFDAFVSYRRRDGTRGFLGIETKLAEPFSQRRYPYNDSRRRYRDWSEHPASPWSEQARPHLDAVAHNQLWRNHMLMLALLHQADSPYTAGRLLLVRHPDDTTTEAVVRAYRQLLVPHDRTFIDLPLDTLVTAWQPLVAATTDQSWLDDFHTRYLDLRRSAADWHMFVSAPRRRDRGEPIA